MPTSRSTAHEAPGGSPAGEPIYPARVSPNGRYFVDQRGEPVFWLGTTQWQLVRDYAVEDARTVIERTKQHGFTFAQVMLLGVGAGTAANVAGQTPWVAGDPRTPNEAYFTHVDAVLQLAQAHNLVIALMLYHQRCRDVLTVETARPWARWVARRYRHVPTLVWSLSPEAHPGFVPVLRELAAGLREGDGGAHLITVHPDPAPCSSGFLHDEPWLDFHSIQTWKRVELIYPSVTGDYGLRPAKPIVLAEGAYERGSEYGFDVTPLWVRRQAYASCLAGAHHAYGHNDSWRVLPTWRQALDAPGARQLGILKRVFLERREWWRLVPDQTLFADGGPTTGRVPILAARHEDGLWAMAYLGGEASVKIRTDQIAPGRGGRATRAFWIDPRTGASAERGHTPAGGPDGAVESFSTPSGWEDALLILEAAAD